MVSCDLTKSGIYVITNIVNGRVYVGSAVSIENRWFEHIRMLRSGSHPSKYLTSAWEKHGEESFFFAVAEYVEQRESLIGREQYWMDRLGAFGPNGYNLTPRAGSQLGFKMSAEAKEKMRIAKLGTTRIFSAEHCAKLSAANRKRFPPLPKRKCVGCDNLIKATHPKKHCSLACKAKPLNVTIVCLSCRKSFSVYRSTSLQKGGSKRFCSRPCYYRHSKEHPDFRVNG